MNNEGIIFFKTNPVCGSMSSSANTLGFRSMQQKNLEEMNLFKIFPNKFIKC